VLSDFVSRRREAEAVAAPYVFLHNGCYAAVLHAHCRELLGSRFDLLLQDPVRKQGPTPDSVYQWNLVDYLADDNLVPRGYNPKVDVKENDYKWFLRKLSEQIQDDLICLLDSQFGEVEYIDEVKTAACQIVVDRVKAASELKDCLDRHDSALSAGVLEVEKKVTQLGIKLGEN